MVILASRPTVDTNLDGPDDRGGPSGSLSRSSSGTRELNEDGTMSTLIASRPVVRTGKLQ